VLRSKLSGYLPMENCQSMQMVISMFRFFLVIFSLNFKFSLCKISPVEIDVLVNKQNFCSKSIFVQKHQVNLKQYQPLGNMSLK